jgi:RNA polymerase sigma-70 factor, ECF subfamily
MSDCPPDPRVLVSRILDGDSAAFRQLVDDYQRLVSHIVFRLISDRQDREDICQDVFVKVYQNLGRFRFESKLSTWIGQIAFNTGISYLEKKKLPAVEETTADYEKPVDGFESPRPDTLAETRDIAEHVRGEIDKLPSHYRVVLTLYHLDGISYAEIADIMNLPEGTVKSHLFRGRKMLKDRLTAKYRVEELWD